ncbi:MAG: glycosyltransferase [Candidatus Pacebacteria bacterium]|nr:glycosyltransferase [Candidatus Paceibacterota bacterium]
MSQKLKILYITTFAVNLIYIVILGFNIVGSLGGLLFMGESLMTSLFFIFAVNHWTQYHVEHTHTRSSKLLDIYVTIVDEPLEIFERTIKTVSEILYENKKIYILDDGGREEIKILALKYGAVYLSRGDDTDYKAGNLNFGLKHSYGEYILVIDADQQITNFNIANELLGYFEKNSKLAILSTRQKFDVPENDFNHDIIFYEHMQSGKNANNAAISCGSGVIYRRRALEEIGGFQTWNIVEDLYTTYVLHSSGYESLYINKSYTIGTAPIDLSTIYKQRGTWALDTLRLFFRRSPLLNKKLTFRQKFHYFELSWAYIGSAVAVPILFILPALTLVLDVRVVADDKLYLITRIPSLIFLLYFYYKINGNNSSGGRFWAALFPIYIKALFLSLLPSKTKYIVTNKLAGVGKRDIALILPHLTLICFSFATVAWRIIFVDHILTPFVGINMMWMVLMIFWFAPVVKKGLLLE